MDIRVLTEAKPPCAIHLSYSAEMPTLALVDIAIILISAIVLIKLTWKINRTASWMLLPYVLWLIFATLLNLLIVLA